MGSGSGVLQAFFIWTLGKAWANEMGVTPMEKKWLAQFLYSTDPQFPSQQIWIFKKEIFLGPSKEYPLTH